MSREYAENRIKEALRLSKGDSTRARRQVAAWTYEDTKLLHALARPHLTGIIAHAVNRVIHNQLTGKGQDKPLKKPNSPDMEPETFGMEIMKALQSNNSQIFGQEGGAPVGRRQASQRHIDSLRAIAGGGKAGGSSGNGEA